MVKFDLTRIVLLDHHSRPQLDDHDEDKGGWVIGEKEYYPDEYYNLLDSFVSTHHFFGKVWLNRDDNYTLHGDNIEAIYGFLEYYTFSAFCE